MKDRYIQLTIESIQQRAVSTKDSYDKKGFKLQKWIIFSLILLKLGWEVFLDQFKNDASKKLRVKDPETGNEYDILFCSNTTHHKDGLDFIIGGQKGAMTTEYVLCRLIHKPYNEIKDMMNVEQVIIKFL